ncbi:MAG: hypothetical protein ABR543_15925 [Gemmatimonadaceae bacterium]
MIHHIDLGTVLRRTVCDLYSDLVTRPTGAAVRTGIERQLEELGDHTLTIIDFSCVGLLDFSCADEIVAKLLLRYCADTAPREAYFIFRGVNASHLDAIETVLERHRLAIVAQADNGEVLLVGTVAAGERKAWEAMCRLGRAGAADLSREAGMDVVESEALLKSLCRRRLVMRYDEAYVAVGAP